MHALQDILGASGISLAGIVAYAYRRFRRAGVSELEPFSRYVTQGIKYYVGRLVRRQLAAELTLRQYARIHLQNTAAEMLVPARYPVRLKVDEVFIPLLLRGPTGDAIEYRDIVEYRGGRLVVVGEPGSGKSSLMKRTYRDACRRANNNPRRAPLPVLFGFDQLSKLSSEALKAITADELFHHIVEDVRKSAVYRAADAIEHLRSGAGYLILLDGLDEVPSDASAAVINAITQLATDLAVSSPRSSVIVTTRTQHYVSMVDREFKEVFGVLTIRPFSTGDVYRFLLRWPFTKERRANIARLYARIRQLPSLNEMCTNPLALSMFVAQDQQTEAAVSPETRSEFYAALVDELIVNRRLRTEEVAVGRQRLRSDRSQVLGGTCLGHLLDPTEARNSIPQSRMTQAVLDKHPDADARAYIRDLAVDTGLFSEEREGETFRFMHLSLCEFLAAQEVVNTGAHGWRKIVERLSSDVDRDMFDAGEWASRLGEVVAFAAGLATRDLRAEIIDDLLAEPDHGLLLRVAIEAQSYDDERVMSAIAAAADKLANVGTENWDVAWFARLRLVISVLRDVHQGARSELPNGYMDDLSTPADYLTGLIDRYEAGGQLLATLARQDASAAVSIAESSGRAELMDVVAAAADDLGVAVGVLARCEAGSHAWKYALVDAALRQRGIAEMLLSISDDMRGRHGRRGWSTAFLTAGSAYGRLLDDVLSAPRLEARSVLILPELYEVDPPQSAFRCALRAVFVGAPQIRQVLQSTFALGITVIAVTLSFVGIVNGSLGYVRWVTAGALALSILIVFFRVSVFRPTRNEFHANPDGYRVRSSVLMRMGRYFGFIVEDDDTDKRVDTITRLWRKPVLEEVLNIGRFTFSAGDTRATDGVPWEPSGIARFLGGVHRADLAALRVARAARWAHSPGRGVTYQDAIVK